MGRTQHSRGVTIQKALYDGGAHGPTVIFTSIYDEAKHKGHLRCPGQGCDAPLHARKGARLKTGVVVHQQDCFVTAPGAHHALTCEFGHMLERGQKKLEYDDALGYRLNLNWVGARPYFPTLMYNSQKTPGLFEDFARSAKPYMHDQDRATTPEQRRRPIALHNVREMVAFMAKHLSSADSARIHNSVVLTGGKAVEWRNFCVHKGRPDALLALPEGDKSHMPMLIQITPIGPGKQGKHPGGAPFVGYDCKPFQNEQAAATRLRLCLTGELSSLPIELEKTIWVLATPKRHNGYIYLDVSDADNFFSRHIQPPARNQSRPAQQALIVA